MSLREYHRKRNFRATSEPSGRNRKPAPEKPAKQSRGVLAYVIQKHRASHLHYDLRLEWKGALLSWAVPKGPSLDPSVKRLAARVEDHPLEYGSFEGIIPEGEYGGGTVMVWDDGTWTPETGSVDGALRQGELKFTLRGKKLKGSWVLVRTRGYGSNADRSWLLIKHRDARASSEDITQTKPYSVLSRRLLAGIARDAGGNVELAATGDPAARPQRRGQTGARRHIHRAGAGAR